MEGGGGVGMGMGHNVTPKAFLINRSCINQQGNVKVMSSTNSGVPQRSDRKSLKYIRAMHLLPGRYDKMYLFGVIIFSYFCFQLRSWIPSGNLYTKKSNEKHIHTTYGITSLP